MLQVAQVAVCSAINTKHKAQIALFKDPVRTVQ